MFSIWFAGSAWRSICLTLALSITVGIVPASAEGPIKDPKQWCGKVAKLTAEKKSDELLKEMVSHSDGLITVASAEQALAPLVPVLKNLGRPHSNELIAEKHYGAGAIRFWYLLVFDRNTLFLRCFVVRRGEHWTGQTVDFNTNPDDLAIP